MNTLTTKAIVLQRSDYGEADRILVVLTDSEGVLHILAKGVRKIKSKLAGGIELFAVNELSVATGKGELKTLISSRMHTAYEAIVKDITRTMLGYEILRFLYRQLEHEAGTEYFTLAQQSLAGLNNQSIHPQLVMLWFYLQYLDINGMQPDMQHDTNDELLKADGRYTYNTEAGRLQPTANGMLGADHIKLIRFLVQHPLPAAARLQLSESLINDCTSIVRNIKLNRT